MPFAWQESAGSPASTTLALIAADESAAVAAGAKTAEDQAEPLIAQPRGLFGATMRGMPNVSR